MKQSLLLTVLLAGAAAAETTADSRVMYTSEITYGSNHTANISTKIGSDKVNVSNPTFTCVDGNGDVVDFLGTSNAMGVDIGTGGSFTLSLNFPVSTQYDSYTVENISFVFGLNDHTGQTYYLDSYTANSGVSDPGFTLGVKVLQGTTVHSTDTLDFTYDGDATKYSAGIQYDTPIELKGDFTLEFIVTGKELTIPDGKNAAYYVSIDQVDVSGKAPQNYNIPEPTTATLSLLALAGLAARRRRK